VDNMVALIKLQHPLISLGS